MPTLTCAHCLHTDTTAAFPADLFGYQCPRCGQRLTIDTAEAERIEREEDESDSQSNNIR